MRGWPLARRSDRMFAATLVFVLWGSAAALITCRLAQGSREVRATVWSALATALCGLNAQLLSPLRLLTGGGLLTAAGLTWLLVWLSVGRPRCDVRTATARAWRATAARLRHPIAKLGWSGLSGLTALLGFLGLAFLNHPAGDLYHLQMPHYWVQHQSIAPFHAPNGRVTAFAFLTQTLRIPFLLYAGVDCVHLILCASALIGLALTTRELARRLGATPSVATATALVTVSCTPFATALAYGALDSLLGALWFSGSVLLLLPERTDLRDPDAGCGEHPGTVPSARDQRALLGPVPLSIFLACMAFGAKNTFVLMAPLYAIALLILVPLRVLRAQLARCTVAASVGLVASGVVWNYTANLLFHGDPRGPATIVAHMADLSPLSIWTRLGRGVATLLDPTWLPISARPAWTSISRTLLEALGAARSLADDQGYYTFVADRIPFRLGLGPAGPLLLAPALAAGALVASGRMRPPTATHAKTQGDGRRASGALLLLGCGGFVVCHGLLRWQPIGLYRLMLPTIAVAGALVAHLLRRRSLYALALALYAGNLILLSAMYLGLAGRKHDLTDPVSRRLRRLQRDHSRQVTIETPAQPPRPITVRERYSKRELYEQLMATLPAPLSIGVIAGPNSEAYYAAGPAKQNRLVPLVGAGGAPLLPDAAARARSLDIIVVEDAAPRARQTLQHQGIQLEQLFRATAENAEPLLRAYRVKPGRNDPERLPDDG